MSDFISAMKLVLKMKDIHGKFEKTVKLKEYCDGLGKSPELSWDDAKMFENAQITATKENLAQNELAVKNANTKKIDYPEPDPAKWKAISDAMKKYGGNSSQAARAIANYRTELKAFEAKLETMKTDVNEVLGVFRVARTNHGTCKTYARELYKIFETFAKLPSADAFSAQYFVYSQDCLQISVTAGKLVERFGTAIGKLDAAVREINSLIARNKEWLDYTKSIESHQKSQAKSSKSSKSGGSSGSGKDDPLLVNIKNNQRSTKPRKLAA